MATVLRALRRGLGAAGLLGGFLCSVSMFAASVGLAAAAGVAAGASGGMPGMGPSAPNSTTSTPTGVVLEFLLAWGPLILAVSVVAITVGLWMRQKAAAVAGLLAGGLLYWGMYDQRNITVMYAAIAVGMAVWFSAFVWAGAAHRYDRP